MLYLWPSTMFGLLIFRFFVHENTLKRSNAVPYLPLIKSSWSSGLLGPVFDPVSTKCVWVSCSFSAATIWLWEQQADFWLTQCLRPFFKRWTIFLTGERWLRIDVLEQASDGSFEHLHLWHQATNSKYTINCVFYWRLLFAMDQWETAVSLLYMLLFASWAGLMMQWDISISWK